MPLQENYFSYIFWLGFAVPSIGRCGTLRHVDKVFSGARGRSFSFCLMFRAFKKAQTRILPISGGPIWTVVIPIAQFFPGDFNFYSDIF